MSDSRSCDIGVVFEFILKKKPSFLVFLIFGKEGPKLLVMVRRGAVLILTDLKQRGCQLVHVPQYHSHMETTKQ